MNTETSIFRRYLLLTFLLAVVCAFAFQGSRGLYESTEGRYTLCAWEMVTNGNWMEPTLLGEHHWTKPPLGYWVIAAGLELFGRNEWGARLPNAIFFCFTSLFVGLLGARMWNDRRTGLLAALVYATAFFPVMTATTVNTDTLLCMWETLAVFCFWAGVTAAGRGAGRWWMIGMWVAFGLGFFTKGPPALLPLLAVIAWNFSRPRAERGWGALFNPAGLVIFAGLACWWFLLVIGRHPELLDYYLKKEVVNRVATNEFGRNAKWWTPFKLYFPVLMLGGGLWTFYFWRPIGDAFRGQAPLRSLSPKVLWRTSGPKLFLVLWLLLPLTVFCLSQSRLTTYVLPLFVPVALAMGRLARQLDWAVEWPKRRLLVLALASTALMVAGRGIAGSMPEINRFLKARECRVAGIYMPFTLEDDKRNMGDLYRVCRKFDVGADTHFLLVTYAPREFLGFDFYAVSPVTRVAPFEMKNKVPGAGVPFVGEWLARRQSTEHLVAICKTNMLSSLEPVLEQRGLRILTREVWCDRTVLDLGLAGGCKPGR